MLVAQWCEHDKAKQPRSAFDCRPPAKKVAARSAPSIHLKSCSSFSKNLVQRIYLADCEIPWIAGIAGQRRKRPRSSRTPCCSGIVSCQAGNNRMTRRLQ